MVLQLSQERDRAVTRAEPGPGAMAGGLPHRPDGAHAALVADGDSVPAAGFQDDQLVGARRRRCEMVCTPRCRFFFDRADHGVAAPTVTWLPGDGGDGGGERPLGVHRAPSEEEIAAAAHGELTGRGVEVADEDRVASTAPPGGDHVACRVHLRVKACVEQPSRQEGREPALITADAGDVHHLREQLDSVDAFHYASTAIRAS